MMNRPHKANESGRMNPAQDSGELSPTNSEQGFGETGNTNPARPRGPKNRRRKFGPPENMPNMGMNPGITQEDAIRIMPEFAKWRDVFCRLDCLLVGAILLLEVLYFFLFYYKNSPQDALIGYLFSDIVIPTGLNFLVLIMMTIARRRLPKDNGEMRQNFLPIISMMLICIIVNICHYQHSLILSIFAIPIYMTTMFTRKEICRLASNISLVGAGIAAVQRIVLSHGFEEHVIATLEGLIMLIFLLVVTQIALALLSMTTEQKDKLFAFAGDARTAQRRAEIANHAKSEFLANMSHEIRTPINAILGMDEMILRESRNPQITDYAENIYSASTSLLHLVNDVLDISKIESGKFEIVESSYDTASFVHDCCNMINERAAKKGLAFHVYCNPNLPSRLDGDVTHLVQAVTNLLSNAAKYTQKGSVTMSVDKHVNQGEFSLVISVEDTGIGIKEEDQEKLFSQFTRFDIERTRTIEGTGLGLSITKQLVDLMHGQIEVHSTYGSGSTFTITVPQKVVDSTPMGDFYERYHEVTKKNVHYQQNFEAPEAKVLVVDDVAVNLKVVTNLLKHTKIKVETADSGKSCLEKVAETAYDIIFMDHMMPEMDGIETYQRMKEMDNSPNKDTPVIMLTANAITGVREEFLKIGFTDYMAKPILGDKLERMILRYLPQDKVTTYNEEVTFEQEPAAQAASPSSRQKNLTLLQDFYQTYPDIDMVHGLSHYGQNTDIYISVLHAFCNKIQPDTLSACYKQKDLRKYEILTHDYKRYAADTGLLALSEKAAALEEAAQKSDWEFIMAQHTNFVTECQTIIDTTRKALDRRKT